MTSSVSDAWDFMWSLEDVSPLPVVVRGIRGHKCTTVEGLFDEFAAALQFPYYFGENWPAFDESITDLEWLPADAYVILIFNAMQLLQAEPLVELHVLLKILLKAGQEWSISHEHDEQWPRPSKAFHVVLQCVKEDEQRLQVMLEKSAENLDERAE